MKWCRGLLLTILSVTLASAYTVASAFTQFGFKSGMSPKQVEQQSELMDLGIEKWFGKSLLIQAQDNQHHSYLFNFCNDKLYSVSQTFPTNFAQMSNFVDEAIRQLGQPIFVSAAGGMAVGGFVRPISLYWKMSDKDYVRLMQLENEYSIIYQSVNDCTKVPQ